MTSRPPGGCWCDSAASGGVADFSAGIMLVAAASAVAAVTASVMAACPWMPMVMAGAVTMVVAMAEGKGPTLDKDIMIDTPVANDMMSPSPRRSRGSSQENNGTDPESVNGIRDVEPNLGGLEGDVHIPGLGKIKEVLFIPEIPYNILAIIKLSKGTKIEVLFKDGTIQLTNDGKEVGDVIVTSGLSYFIPTINTTAQVIANLSNDGIKNGKEEGKGMIMPTVTQVSFNIKVANQKFVQVVWKGDVHIPGLGKIKEVLFIPEIPYNILAIIKLSKGTKIEVLFKDGTVQLTNDGKEVGDVIVTSGLSYFIPTINTTAQVIANLSNDGIKNGKEEGERDDNANSDTSDGEIEGESDNDNEIEVCEMCYAWGHVFKSPNILKYKI
ncbi:hypothetical protein E2320_000013 [Naja naja]|nr:hypothetical protein E2320_000013 [Naja naja]